MSFFELFKKVPVRMDTDRAVERMLANKDVLKVVADYTMLQERIGYGGGTVADRELVAKAEAAIVSVLASAGVVLEAVASPYSLDEDESVRLFVKELSQEQDKEHLDEAA